MSKVKDLIAESKKNSSGRKTKNQDEYLSMLIAVLTDEEYITKNIKEIKNGEIITEDFSIAPGFLKLVVSIFKKSGMSEAEATAAAKAYKLSKADAKTLVDAVRECDFLITKECGKKIQLFKKPGYEFTMTMDDAKESIRPNPQDSTKKIRIKARKRVKVQQTLHAFQKEMFKA